MSSETFNAVIEYPDIKKKVVYCFSTVHQLGRFLQICVGNLPLDDSDPDFRLTADLAAEWSKVNTWRIQYSMTIGTACLMRDLYNYNKVVRRSPYKIIVNGVIHTCPPALTLTLKRAR